jgi:small-conductance mechanosensitive channel
MTFRPLPFRSDLNYGIERALREGGIEIPFPQRDLHIRSSAVGMPRNETNEGV